MKQAISLLMACLVAISSLGAQEKYSLEKDIPYSVKTDEYSRERLKLPGGGMVSRRRPYLREQGHTGQTQRQEDGGCSSQLQAAAKGYC